MEGLNFSAVLDVAPLRAVPPGCPPPPPPNFSAAASSFVYVSPFSPIAAQFRNTNPSYPSRHGFDPSEAHRTPEEEIVYKDKRAQNAALRNFLKTQLNHHNNNNNNTNNDNFNDYESSSNPNETKNRRKHENPKNQGVFKDEGFDQKDDDVHKNQGFGGRGSFFGCSPKTPGTQGYESNLKRQKRTKSVSELRASKGAAVFRSVEGDADGFTAAVDRKLVRMALMTYDTLRRKLVREDEASKDGVGGESCKRPDLKAGSIMMDRGLSVNRERRVVGSVPGVSVGDIYYFRMELCVIGLHSPIMAGIDYVNGKGTEWSEPVATSIISSGGYEDNVDDGEVLIYSGQGGNSHKMDGKQTDDQKLERGNLALERSMHHGVEVRVVRGMKDGSSPSGKVYVYDGLYKVQESWLDKGRSGFSVFKYKLLRIPGQPQLGSTVLKTANLFKSQPSSRHGFLLADISSGMENIRVCLANNVDSNKGPAFFEYISKVKYSNSVGRLKPSQGCGCKNNCAFGENCSCISINGNEIPFISNGYLVKWKPMIYVCGDECRCPPSCRNRVSLKGLKYHLEVFKTKDRGWGVRSWDTLPAGSFVCECIGEVLSDSDVEQEDEDNNYLLHSDHVQENEMACTGISDLLYEAKKGTSNQTTVQFHIAIDTSKMGNVSRFINHSCSPNLFRQAVLYDHHDTRFPHVILFAKGHIPPLTELTLDYGVHQGAGKSKICLCGSSDCRQAGEILCIIKEYKLPITNGWLR